MAIILTSLLIALTFIIIFEYGRPYLRRLCLVFGKLTVLHQNKSTQTEDSIGIEREFGDDGDGHVPFAVVPDIGNIPVGDGHVPFADHKVPPPPIPFTPQIQQQTSEPGFPLVYVAPGLFKGFKYHPQQSCRYLQRSTLI